MQTPKTRAERDTKPTYSNVQKQPSQDAAAAIMKIVPHLEAGAVGYGYAYCECSANCFVARRHHNVVLDHAPCRQDPVALEQSINGLLTIVR